MPLWEKHSVCGKGINLTIQFQVLTKGLPYKTTLVHWRSVKRQSKEGKWALWEREQLTLPSHNQGVLKYHTGCSSLITQPLKLYSTWSGRGRGTGNFWPQSPKGKITFMFFVFWDSPPPQKKIHDKIPSLMYLHFLLLSLKLKFSAHV